MAEDQAKTLQYAQRFEDANPVVPKSERREFYDRVKVGCPALWAQYGTRMLPHHRLIDNMMEHIPFVKTCKANSS